jgi:hypothetical protein
MVRESSEEKRNFRDDRGCAPPGIRNWRAQHVACVGLPLVRHESVTAAMKLFLSFVCCRMCCLKQTNTICTEPLGSSQTRGRALQFRLSRLDGRRSFLAQNPFGPQSQASSPHPHHHTPRIIFDSKSFRSDVITMRCA